MTSNLCVNADKMANLVEEEPVCRKNIPKCDWEPYWGTYVFPSHPVFISPWAKSIGMMTRCILRVDSAKHLRIGRSWPCCILDPR